MYVCILPKTIICFELFQDKLCLHMNYYTTNYYNIASGYWKQSPIWLILTQDCKLCSEVLLLSGSGDTFNPLEYLPSCLYFFLFLFFFFSKPQNGEFHLSALLIVTVTGLRAGDREDVWTWVSFDRWDASAWFLKTNKKKRTQSDPLNLKFLPWGGLQELWGVRGRGEEGEKNLPILRRANWKSQRGVPKGSL